MVIDIHAMETNNKRKKWLKRSNSTNTLQSVSVGHAHAHAVNVSASVGHIPQAISPQTSPDISPGHSLKDLVSSKKTLKGIKKCFDGSDNYQEVIGYGLVAAAK